MGSAIGERSFAALSPEPAFAALRRGRRRKMGGRWRLRLMHFDSLPRPLPSQEERREIRFNDLTLQRNTMPYVELHACSAFSFLRGASFPEQLAETAAELAMPAMALLDRNGVYGAQRFSVAAREYGVRPIIGCELSMEDGGILPVLVQNRSGYKNLCELLTQAHLRSEKGKCAVRWEELPDFAEGLVALFGLESTGCQPVASGSLPDAISPRVRRLMPRLRQAAVNNRLAACA